MVVARGKGVGEVEESKGVQYMVMEGDSTVVDEHTTQNAQLYT